MRTRGIPLWVRWLGWTALCGAGLGLWDAALLSWDVDMSFQILGIPGLVWFDGLVAAAVALAIGVRLAHWSWTLGVAAASVVRVVVAILSIDWGPAASGGGQAALGVMLFLGAQVPVLILAASAGIWWGKRGTSHGAWAGRTSVPETGSR